LKGNMKKKKGLINEWFSEWFSGNEEPSELEKESLIALHKKMIETVEKYKPVLRRKHDLYCLYRKDTARDINECNCDLASRVAVVCDQQQELRISLHELEEKK